MEELVLKFLMQSGYPRASLVSDLQSLSQKAEAGAVSYVVVDPVTTDKLAAISVVGPVNADGLIEHCERTAQFANHIGSRQAQGFVVRVDIKAKREAEQVQFYRSWPNKDIQQLNAHTFPDIDSLKVHHKLSAEAKPTAPVAVDELLDEDEHSAPRMGIGAYLPALILLVLAAGDWALRFFSGVSILDVTHSLLLIGGATLLTLPALVRYLRH